MNYEVEDIVDVPMVMKLMDGGLSRDEAIGKARKAYRRPQMIYEVEDQIISGLDLPDPCPIRIKVNKEGVTLSVGQRDWQWDKDGKWIGQGIAVYEGTD